MPIITSPRVCSYRRPTGEDAFAASVPFDPEEIGRVGQFGLQHPGALRDVPHILPRGFVVRAKSSERLVANIR
jgi:hypothetical protein